MKNIHSKNLLAGMIAIASLFCSCSRQMTSMTGTQKMIYRQALENGKAKPNTETALCLTETGTVQAADVNTSVSAKPALETKPAMHVKIKKHVISLARISPKEVVRDIKAQTAVIKGLVKNKNVASYTRNQATQGYLGIAGICLIIAIVLGVLGFTSGKLFWELGVILIVAAVVFFLLYLINRAASPATP